jgi:hypothetical protein
MTNYEQGQSKPSDLNGLQRRILPVLRLLGDSRIEAESSAPHCSQLLVLTVSSVRCSELEPFPREPRSLRCASLNPIVLPSVGIVVRDEKTGGEGVI